MRLLGFLSIIFSLPSAHALSQPERRWSDIEKPATEAELQVAVNDIEQLSRLLRAGLEKYRERLVAALWHQGYGPYHPLFRTSVNGFAQDQIDLEDLNEFKMGALAYRLQDAGTLLDPDPFAYWKEVQNNLAEFEKRIDNARRVVARSNIFDAHTGQNIPPKALRQLRKRWLVTVEQATNAYEHAMAVRAIDFQDGEIVPAAARIRRIFGGGRYGVICAFSVCTSQSTIHDGEISRTPLVH